MRSRAIRALLGRCRLESRRSSTSSNAIQARLSELALDQKQALAAHPNREIAARAKKLLEQGGGLPDPDRQQVIDRLAP